MFISTVARLCRNSYYEGPHANARHICSIEIIGFQDVGFSSEWEMWSQHANARNICSVKFCGFQVVCDHSEWDLCEGMEWDMWSTVDICSSDDFDVVSWFISRF